MMIHELQLGNWVEYQGKPYKVVFLNSFLEECLRLDAGHGCTIDIIYSELPNVKPLGITAERLEDCGFRVDRLKSCSVWSAFYSSPRSNIKVFYSKDGFELYVYNGPHANIELYGIDGIHIVQQAMAFVGLRKEALNIEITE